MAEPPRRRRPSPDGQLTGTARRCGPTPTPSPRRRRRGRRRPRCPGSRRARSASSQARQPRSGACRLCSAGAWDSKCSGPTGNAGRESSRWILASSDASIPSNVLISSDIDGNEAGVAQPWVREHGAERGGAVRPERERGEAKLVRRARAAPSSSARRPPRTRRRGPWPPPPPPRRSSDARAARKGASQAAFRAGPGAA